jgi:serine/threonine protein kinase
MTSNSNSINADTDDLAQWLEGGVTGDYINYYDYSEFKKIQFIGYGAFGNVYRAIWEKSLNSVVALKVFENNKTVVKEIVNEVNKVMSIF